MPILKTASYWRPREAEDRPCSWQASGRTPISRASSKRGDRLTSNFGYKRWKREIPGRTSSDWLFFGPANRGRESSLAPDSAVPLKREAVHNLPVLFCGRIGGLRKRTEVGTRARRLQEIPDFSFWLFFGDV